MGRFTETLRKAMDGDLEAQNELLILFEDKMRKYSYTDGEYNDELMQCQRYRLCKVLETLKKNNFL